MSSNTYTIAAISVMAGITLLLRTFPFVAFGKKKRLAMLNFLENIYPMPLLGCWWSIA